MYTDHLRLELATLTDQTVLTIGQIRAAWGWLGEALTPTRTGWTQHAPLTDTQREALDAQAFRERSYKAANAKVGLSALAPKAPPARLNPVDVRAEIQTTLLELAAELHRTITGRALPHTPNPAERVHFNACTCRALGRLPIPSTLGPAWTPCPHGLCLTCRSRNSCQCGPADARVNQALNRITALLPSVRVIEQARAIHSELARAERQARLASGADPTPRILIHVECPACQHRSLQVHNESPNPPEWAIVCTTRTCRCRADCPCGRAIQWRGTQHLWLNHNDGWRALASVLNATDRLRLELQLPTGTAA